jgi:glycosyltransferase involved in cell wall biosynthesis
LSATVAPAGSTNPAASPRTSSATSSGTLRILHAPEEIAGQMGLSVLGLRERGHRAESLAKPHRFAYGIPPDIPVRGNHRWQRDLHMRWLSHRLTGRYDVVHFHFGKSLTRSHADVRRFRRAGAGVVVEFWGSDARLPSVECARNPYYRKALGEDEEKIRRRLATWAELTDGHVVAADHSFRPWLEPYFEHVHLARQRIDTRAYRPCPPDPEVEVPVVVHCPSRVAVGTEHVRAAVEELTAKGLRFEYVELTGVPHAEVLAALERADLVVDQLMLGSNGVFSIEAMSTAKPVIAHVLPELLPTFPEGFPIVGATPETIRDVLEEWLQRPEDRHRVGAAGREYAERVHDCRAVADDLVEIYGRLPR